MDVSEMKEVYASKLKEVNRLLTENPVFSKYFIMREEIEAMEKELKSAMIKGDDVSEYYSYKIVEGKVTPLIMKPTVTTTYNYDIKKLTDKFGENISPFIVKKLNVTALGKAEKELARDIKTYLTSEEMYKQTISFRSTKLK